MIENVDDFDVSDLPIIRADDFARRFILRAEKLMWFLGAGASAAAGIPTASDMTWEFKQRAYAIIWSLCSAVISRARFSVSRGLDQPVFMMQSRQNRRRLDPVPVAEMMPGRLRSVGRRFWQAGTLT